MALFKNMIMTYKGMVLHAKAQAGQEIHFSKLQVGSGQVETQDPAALIKLVNAKFDVPITAITPYPEMKNCIITGNITNRDVIEATYICEIGLFAIDPDEGEILYGYCSSGTYGDYYAPATQGAFNWEYNIAAAVGNAANITAVIIATNYDYSLTNTNKTFVKLTGGNQKEINKSIDTFIDQIFKDLATQKAEIGTEVTNRIKEVNNSLDTKTDKADCIANNNFAVTTGNSIAYEVSLTSPPTEYKEGMNITINPHVTCGVSPTININGLGVVSLKNNDGENLNAEDLVAGRPYSFVRVGTSFFQRSGSSVTDTLPKQVNSMTLQAKSNAIDITIVNNNRNYIAGYVLTYKKGSAPRNINDGTKFLVSNITATTVTVTIDGLENDVTYYVRCFPFNSRKQYQTDMMVGNATPKKGILISSLPIGAVINMGSYRTQTETREAIRWLLVDKAHSGYDANAATLITQKIIDIIFFDGGEYQNTDADRAKYGNNRYSLSNIRQWLNKSINPWYVATHTYDMSPSSAWGQSLNVGYNEKQGFLSAFNSQELGIMLQTSVKVAKNTSVDGGSNIETVTDRVFLPSIQELGGSVVNTYSEGSAFTYFSDDESRKCRMTKQCFDYAVKGGVTPGTADTPYKYTTRTPYASGTTGVCFVSDNGTQFPMQAYYATGLRPCVNIDMTKLVKAEPNADGSYELIL